jgi:diaminopimelate decarboxylase
LKNSFQPDLYTECGRYVTGPHGVLVNRVINICQKYQKFVGVQVAMPALMRHGMYGSYHHCTVLDRNGCEKDGRREKVSIVGPICENIDRLGTYLLPKIEVGDYIVTHDTGAHGIAMGFNYNGRTRPQVLMLKKNNMVVLTCKKETYSDLIRRQKGLGMPEGAYSF